MTSHSLGRKSPGFVAEDITAQAITEQDLPLYVFYSHAD